MDRKRGADPARNEEKETCFTWKSTTKVQPITGLFEGHLISNGLSMSDLTSMVLSKSDLTSISLCTDDLTRMGLSVTHP